MAGALTRRSVVRLLGAASVLAPALADAEPAPVTKAKPAAPKAKSAPKAAAAKRADGPAARTARLAPLIAQAQAAHPASVSQRMEAISRGLLGVRYVANTLVGGPGQPEQFVVRDDAFDCVTYCETVLAAALAGSLDSFEQALKRVRYARGQVRWDERNHYFADWCRANVENKTCRWVALAEAATVRKTVNIGNLGQRRVSFQGIPGKALLAQAAQAANGDIIGFASRQANLDFFHTGLVMVGEGGTLMLRHASLRRRRVIEEPLAGFLATNRVEQVALLRAAEPGRA